MDWSRLPSSSATSSLAMALVTGIVGRWLLLTSAERSERLERAEALLEASRPVRDDRPRQLESSSSSSGC